MGGDRRYCVSGDRNTGNSCSAVSKIVRAFINLKSEFVSKTIKRKKKSMNNKSVCGVFKLSMLTVCLLLSGGLSGMDGEPLLDGAHAIEMEDRGVSQVCAF